VRHWFGQSPSDWTFALGTANAVVLSGGKNLTFWSQPSGGVQYLDLLDATGAEVSSIASATGDGELPVGTIPRFLGPEGITAMWVDGGAGARFIMLAVDIGDSLAVVNATAAAVTALQAAMAALATVASTGAYADLSGAPTLADVAETGQYADLLGAPPPGLQIVVKVGASWPLRAGTAPDISRPAMWIGPAPAPTAGAGYALESDLWVATP
jgi:hypothetical protein